MTLLVASLYLLVLAGLFGSALYVLSLDPFSRLNRAYAALALAQLAWVLTLFVFNGYAGGATLLRLGRGNFAAAALVPPAVLAFVWALQGIPLRRRVWMLAETFLVAALSLGTGLVDRSEAVLSGVHVTAYGALFPLYVLHLLLYLVPALWRALFPGRRTAADTGKLSRLVGAGLLATAAVGLLANVVLPYVFGDFRWIDAGTLATVAALGAIAYAACVHHLFNVEVVVRKAVVLALLVAFALELYQAAVEALARLLPLGDVAQRHAAAAAVVLIVNAFTHEPLRKLLEKLADRLLGGGGHRANHR